MLIPGTFVWEQEFHALFWSKIYWTLKSKFNTIVRFRNRILIAVKVNHGPEGNVEFLFPYESDISIFLISRQIRSVILVNRISTYKSAFDCSVNFSVFTGRLRSFHSTAHQTCLPVYSRGINQNMRRHLPFGPGNKRPIACFVLSELL